MKRFWIPTVLSLALFAGFAGRAGAQDGQHQHDSPVSGLSGLGHTVANLDKTLAFYRDIFQFELDRDIRRNYNDPGAQKLTNTPGASLDIAWLKVPGAGFNLELIEVKGVDRKMLAPPRQTAPGAAELNLQVRDIEPILAAVKAKNAEIITLGGVPLPFNRNGNPTRHIFVRDPDGFILEVTQAAPPPNAPPSNVFIGIIGMTTGDVEKSLHFYRDLLGFPLKTGDWIVDKRTMNMIGEESGQIRQTRSEIPGSKVRYEIYEYRDIKQTPFRPRFQDPGATLFTLTVPDIRKVFKTLKDDGVEVVSAGGDVIDRGPIGAFVMVRDPNGVIVELIQRAAR
jgi:catechol 2,3-dioxygenase-like lactoylglutathione lyase family enzyme